MTRKELETELAQAKTLILAAQLFLSGERYTWTQELSWHSDAEKWLKRISH